jgi:hypothetical protein
MADFERLGRVRAESGSVSFQLDNFSVKLRDVGQVGIFMHLVNTFGVI